MYSSISVIRFGAVLLSVSTISSTNAFVTLSTRQRTLPSSSATPLTRHHAVTNSDRVTKVGCGVFTIPPGNRLLFDPEKEGKLQGTGALEDRISRGPAFVLSDTSSSSASSLPIIAAGPPAGTEVKQAQHWLEHLDDGSNSLPLNFAKASNPTTATLLARTRIISNDAPGDIQHIVLRLPQGMHYVEGQSLSVIPPGLDAKTNRKHSPRLYSIASTRYGDALDGNTVSLCVRRAEYYDPVTNQVDPAKKGVCSNFLCDAQPGATVSVAGPVGKTMLLPKDVNTDVIMIATGTGIAPFRGFMHRMFMEETLRRHMFGGTAWLVLGVPTTGGLLYKEEFDAMMINGQCDLLPFEQLLDIFSFCDCSRLHFLVSYLFFSQLTYLSMLEYQPSFFNTANPGQLKIDYAISREMTNSIDGGKLYVQHVIAQNAQEFFDRLEGGANVYFCGLKGMMPPILETLEKVAAEKGIDWDEKLKFWKANHQWHVEVY